MSTTNGATPTPQSTPAANSAASPVSAASHGHSYREKLWPSWWVWVSALTMAVGFGLITTRVSDSAAVVVGLAAAAVLFGALTLNTPEVAVRDDTLVAGRARVPMKVVGDPEPLDAEAMRQAMGPQANALAFLCTRGWISGGVKVPLHDPDDPTPYWLISSRRPPDLAEAIRQAR